MMPLGLTPPSGGGGVGSMRVVELTDFTGGLNLSADRFKLQLNESHDMLNVDVHERGGIHLRGGMTALTEIDETIVERAFTGSWKHIAADGSEFLSVGVGADVFDVAAVSTINTFGVGAGVEPSFAALDMTQPDELFGVQMNDATYVTSRRYGPQRMTWGGVNLVWDPLTEGGAGSWDEDIAGAGTDVFPRARCASMFANRMWVASTIEDGIEHRNRIRFSVDGNPEQWRADDWIDVDVGEDGDQITALATHGEFLLVFKANSMYAVYPSETLGFGLASVASSVGAIGPYAVQASPLGLWFWDAQSGLHVWNSGAPVPAGQKLLLALESARIPTTGMVTMGWVNSRLWVSSSLDGADVNFVFDPQTAAWLVHSPSVVSPEEFSGDHVGYSAFRRQWLKIDLPTTVDDFGDGPVRIAAHWTSAHIHGGAYYRKKKFRSPRFVMSSDADATIPVTVTRNQDPGDVVRQFNLDLTVRSEGLVWGVDDWGTKPWVSSGAAVSSELKRGKPLCSAYSVQFRFDSPAELVGWRLDSFAVPYIPKALR